MFPSSAEMDPAFAPDTPSAPYIPTNYMPSASSTHMPEERTSEPEAASHAAQTRKEAAQQLQPLPLVEIIASCLCVFGVLSSLLLAHYFAGNGCGQFGSGGC